jgi:hypothetical protein
MREQGSSNRASKVRQLARIAQELRTGSHFSVTRLSIVKGFCKEPEAANRFVVHLAKLTQTKMKKGSWGGHASSGTRMRYKSLAGQAVSEMEGYLGEQTTEKSALLEKVLSKVQGVQTKRKRMKWGSARIIESTELLLVENALRCVLFPHQSTYWGYQVAKGYAERYDSQYGNGLIPKSARMVEDIADFWCEYFFEVPLNQWLAARKGERK